MQCPILPLCRISGGDEKNEFFLVCAGFDVLETCRHDSAALEYRTLNTDHEIDEPDAPSGAAMLRRDAELSAFWRRCRNGPSES